MGTEIVKAAIPGVLSLAKEFPFVGPAAGIVLDFYRQYESMSANKEAFKGLKEQCDFSMKLFSDSGFKNTVKRTKAAYLTENRFKRVRNDCTDGGDWKADVIEGGR